MVPCSKTTGRGNRQSQKPLKKDRGFSDQYALNLNFNHFGIADDIVFEGKRTPGDCVQFDPRDATVELGLKFVTTAINHLVEFVNAAYVAL